jgi:Emfourin
MRIDFEQTGGFAGMRLAAAFDTATLPADQASALQKLVDAAHFFDLPAQMPPPANAADQFHYHMTIEAAGKRHTVDVDESSASRPLQALLQQLTLLARSARGA